MSDRDLFGRMEREEAHAVSVAERFGTLVEVEQPPPEFDDEGNGPYMGVDPPGLTFDVSHCQNPVGCASDPAASVGWTLHEDDDEPWRSGAVWHETWKSETGLFLCCDCAVWVQEGCPPNE